MKYNKMDLIGTLTIVLAITTAFTTKSNSGKYANDFEVWSISSNAVSYDVTDCVTVTANFMTKLYDGGPVQPPGSTSADKLDNAITNYNNSHNPDFVCTIDITHMCVAYINRGSCVVLATNDGDANF